MQVGSTTAGLVVDRVCQVVSFSEIKTISEPFGDQQRPFLHTGTRKIGITVDEVAEVLSIYEHEMETNSGALHAVHALVGSIVKRDKRLIQVLNMEQVMVQLEGAAV